MTATITMVIRLSGAGAASGDRETDPRRRSADRLANLSSPGVPRCSLQPPKAGRAPPDRSGDGLADGLAVSGPDERIRR
jgi:hypothetical protein